MRVFQRIGKTVNKVGGDLAYAGVKTVSKVISSKNKELGNYIGEVGETVIDASKATIDNVSKFSDGTVQGTYGLIQKDEYHKQQGWSNIKESTSRTIKGIGSGVVFTVKSAGLTIKGLQTKDNAQIKVGLKILGRLLLLQHVR